MKDSKFLKFWTEELKTKQQQQQQQQTKRMCRFQWLEGYLDIFSVQIKGWIPRDGHVVIIINTRLQITNFTKVLTYQHWDHGDLSRAKVCYCLNRKWISIAPLQVGNSTVRPSTSFLAPALTVVAACTVPFDQVMLWKLKQTAKLNFWGKRWKGKTKNYFIIWYKSKGFNTPLDAR